MKIILSYYLFFFMLAIYLGITSGFTDTDTPPLPFVIELPVLIVGFIWFRIDLRRTKTETKFNVRKKAHLAGITLNGLVLLYIFILYNR